MFEIDGFKAKGTASFPTHKFFFSSPNDENVLIRFVMRNDKSNFYYDPYEVEGNPKLTAKNVAELTFEEYRRYEKHQRSKIFNEKYKDFTGREYLSYYPRPQPSHKIWPADYDGQQHWVSTRETHFNQLPPENLLKTLKTTEHRILRDDEPRILNEYRSEGGHLNLTLEVVSFAPRVFVIEDFLSTVEVDHILKLASGMDLQKSSTSEQSDIKKHIKNAGTKTRTSYNSWVGRETDQIVDSIYRRAADLLRIDESLLRWRQPHEYPDLKTKSSIAEALQLVHYDPGQEYTAHHDFGYYYDIFDEYQGARFATLLLYLNEGMDGGETEFPRWVNGRTSKGLRITPKKGLAVLFYSQLPDGNMDDLSHHAALPVIKGEKWLMNLWVWDPVR